MAMVVDEAAGMVRHLFRLREDQFHKDKEKDPIEEEILSPSPINLESFLKEHLKRDLDPKKITTGNDGDTSTRKAEGSKTVIKVFDASLSSSSFVFPKVAVQKSLAPQPSALSDLISKDLAKKQKALENVLTFTLTVWMPSRDSVQVQMAEKSTVEEVIKGAIQQYEIDCADRTKHLRINMNPKAYVLRFADDDGSPDDDMPALVKTQEIGQFKGCTKFCLCPDTSFKVVKSSTNEAQTTPRMQLFRVYLPDSLGSGCISVAYQSKLTLGEVMETVCKKRAFNANEYQFDYSAGFAPPGSNPPKLNLSMTLGELGVPRLDLLEKKNIKDKERKNTKSSIGKAAFQRLRARAPTLETGDAPKNITKRLGPMFYLNNLNAVQYQEFPVVKINKYGTRQERTLGIDNRAISNKIPEKSAKSTKKQAKHSELLLRDIVKVGLSGVSNQFFIELKTKTNKYESAKAEEIVAKLQYLQKNNLIVDS